MQCSIVSELIKLFAQVTFSNNIHFTCTGALAIESALKAAFDYKNDSSSKVISIKDSFHGVNGWGLSTSLTGFTGQRLDNFPRLEWPNLTLDSTIDYLIENTCEDICAVIIEPIQCTNGDIHLDRVKLKQLYQLCQNRDICFILDEIQTGFGTTGKVWYYEYLGFEPDILVFGKKSQVCGIVLQEKYSPILELETMKLQVTFDGDLIDILRCKYILSYLLSNNILSNVIKGSQIFKNHLSHKFTNYRTEGYLIAFDLETEQQRNEFVSTCYQQKLLVNKAGSKSIRLRPNLAITDAEIAQAIQILLSVKEKINGF